MNPGNRGSMDSSEFIESGKQNKELKNLLDTVYAAPDCYFARGGGESLLSAADRNKKTEP